MRFVALETSILDPDYEFAPEIDREAKLVRTVSRWVRSYLCQPHSKLGRSGPVCPFTEPAVRLGQIWVAVAPETACTVESVARVSLIGQEFFRRAPENTGAAKEYKAVLVLFPHLNTPSGHEIIVEVQRLLKPGFVTEGLMCGQFYQRCPEPGLANPIFRPLSSPVPLLAIRYMVEADIVFLRNPPMLEHYARHFPEVRLIEEKTSASER